MQRQRYLKRPGNEREHGNFKREKLLWPDKVGTKNNKKKFKSFKHELMIILYFLIFYFGYTMQKTYWRGGEEESVGRTTRKLLQKSKQEVMP